MTDAPYFELALISGGKRFVVRFHKDATAEGIRAAMKCLTDWLASDPKLAERIANGIAEGV